MVRTLTLTPLDGPIVGVKEGFEERIAKDYQIIKESEEEEVGDVHPGFG